MTRRRKWKEIERDGFVYIFAKICRNYFKTKDGSGIFVIDAILKGQKNGEAEARKDRPERTRGKNVMVTLQGRGKR